MHKRTHVTLLLLAALVALPLVPAPARAQDAGASTEIFVETDPATFVLRGFAGHVRVRPAALPRWLLGVGMYAMDFPSLLVDLSPANRDEGWDVRLRLGGGVFADYFLRPAPAGWFIGAEAALLGLRASRGAEAARFVNVLLMPRVGYLARPFASGFFLMPWLGVGVTARVAGSADAGGETYELYPVSLSDSAHVAWHAALHVGWRF